MEKQKKNTKKDSKVMREIINQIMINITIILISGLWINLIWSEYPQCIGDLDPAAYYGPPCELKDFNIIMLGTFILIIIIITNIYYQIIYEPKK